MSRMITLQGDCLDVMPTLQAASVDLVLCDLPYGTTQNKWDSVIPLEPLWAEYARVCKGAVVLTSSQPFTSALVMSNLQAFKYEWMWHKSNATGHLNAKKMPMSQHESILVFAEGKVLYNPQFFQKNKPRAAQRSVKSKGSYGDFKAGEFRSISDDLGYPRSVVSFSTAYHAREAGLHPTQKPVALMEYFIKTYTNSGDTILDNCMGSDTTGVACVNTGRIFIGIEKDEKYFEIAKQRIEDRQRLLAEVLS